MKTDPSYLDSITDHQEKIYSPGAYAGGKLHPATLAKTKAGAWAIIFIGIFFLGISMFQILVDFSFENVGGLIYTILGLILFIGGIRNLRKKETT